MKKLDYQSSLPPDPTLAWQRTKLALWALSTVIALLIIVLLMWFLRAGSNW
jgi:hypothetical protein